MEVKGLSQFYFEFELSKDDTDPISQQLARASLLLHQHDKTLFLHDIILHPCSSFKPAVRDFWEWHERPTHLLGQANDQAHYSRLSVFTACLVYGIWDGWYALRNKRSMMLCYFKIRSKQRFLVLQKGSERPANLPSPSDLG